VRMSIPFYVIPSALSVVCMLVLASFVLTRNIRSVMNRSFAAGFFVLAVVEFSHFMLLTTTSFVWIRVSLVGMCLLPGTMAVFSLVFARKNYQESLKQWRFVLGVIVLLAAWFLYQSVSGAFLLKTSQLSLHQFEVYQIQPIGGYFIIFLLLSIVFVLYNLEHTYRNASDTLKWQIKYLVIGIFAVAFFDIFLLSSMLLYRVVRVEYVMAKSIVLIVASVLILFSLVRYRLMDTDVFISRQVVYNSVIIFVTGAYLITIASIGYLAKYRIVQREITQFLVVEVFMYVAILGLVLMLLSESVRRRVERYISKHFYRHKYEYDEVWIAFTRHIGSQVSLEGLLPQLVASVQEILNVNRVYIFLHDASTDQLILRQSSIAIPSSAMLPMTSPFVQYFRNTHNPHIALSAFTSSDELQALYHEHHALLENLEIALCAPLRVKDQFIGLLAVGEEQTGEPYSYEDYALLHTIGMQAASAILNVKLSEDLSQARALETFHNFSAFIVHDLKNAVQSLSLVVESAPDFMDNPEFWQDALENIVDSVARMNNLIARLSSVPKELEIERHEVLLKLFFEETVKQSKVSKLEHLTVHIDIDDPILTVPLDYHQIQSVLFNLLSNAAEAMSNRGEIRIQAAKQDNWVKIAISDTGSGIPPDTLDALFMPFKSTKQKGLGIGLYQCKTILEAHGGRIFAESIVGQGTTFHLELPTGSILL
jgi:putative PEP-CTERM system histidine kinase